MLTSLDLQEGCSGIFLAHRTHRFVQKLLLPPVYRVWLSYRTRRVYDSWKCDLLHSIHRCPHSCAWSSAELDAVKSWRALCSTHPTPSSYKCWARWRRPAGTSGRLLVRHVSQLSSRASYPLSTHVITPRYAQELSQAHLSAIEATSPFGSYPAEPWLTANPDWPQLTKCSTAICGGIGAGR